MNTKGFTLIEALLVVAVVSILGGLTYNQVASTREAAHDSKLSSDVQTLNNAATVYQTFGGTIPADATAAIVLAKLKTRRSAASANTSSGITGSYIDRRVSPIWMTDTEMSSTQMRAIWDANSRRFVIVEEAGTAGIKEFTLDDALASNDFATEARSDAMKTSDRSSANANWVWNYEDSVAMNTPTAPSDFSGAAGSYPTSVAEAQAIEAGTFIVADDGIVDVSYVFREAGYNSRLALFSLEGMGPNDSNAAGVKYDLDTAAGQKAFLAEAIRRVIEGDAGNGNLGKTIIDASKSSVGFNQTYTFRGGDTVAAIMIPNASFETALSKLNSGTANAQQTPLTSITRKGGQQAPFYANQYASLGEGTSAFAIEDIATVGSSDNDYQDLLFKANGLKQAQTGSTYTISNPVEFYRNDKYWEKGPDGKVSSGLHARLIATGIIPSDTPLWPVGPAGYTYVANEGGSYKAPKIGKVVYGANGTFTAPMSIAANQTVTFNSTIFGDPIPGTAKFGFYKKN